MILWGGYLVDMQQRQGTMADQDFYRFLREQASHTGMTIREIGAAAGIPPNSVSMFLNGNIQKIHVEMLYKLSPVLGVPFEALCRLAVGLPWLVNTTAGQAQHTETADMPPAPPGLSNRALAVAAQFDALPWEIQEGVLVMVTRTRLHRGEQLQNGLL